MNSRLALILALLAMGAQAAAAPRSMAKKKAAAVEEAAEEEADPLEENLGKSLAKALGQCLEAMDSFTESAAELESRNLSRSKALNRMGEARQDFAGALQRGRDAKAPEQGQAAQDAFLVAASQGLRGMDLYMEGVREGDDEKQEKGQRLGELAYADIEGLQSGAGQVSGGGPSGPGGKIGSSVGFNGSASFATGSTNSSLGLTWSTPITDSVDVGLGTTFGVNGSESPGGGGFSSTGTSSYQASMNLGGNVFLRKHFLQFIPDKPWVVPYVGALANLGVNMDIINDTSSTSNGYGLQVGILVFSNKNSAVSFQYQWDATNTGAPSSSSSSSTAATGAGSGTSSSSSTLSLGMRYML